MQDPASQELLRETFRKLEGILSAVEAFQEVYGDTGSGDEVVMCEAVLANLGAFLQHRFKNEKQTEGGRTHFQQLMHEVEKGAASVE